MASAFTLATTFFAAPFALLYSFLSSSSPVRIHIFSLSSFSLTAFSVSSFHHQLSSLAFFFPDDLPHTSSPQDLINPAVSSHHYSTFSVVTSCAFAILSTTLLLKPSLTSLFFSFHHRINFRPSTLLFLVALTSSSVISTRYCVVMAYFGSTLQFLHFLVYSFLSMMKSICDLLPPLLYVTRWFSLFV